VVDAEKRNWRKTKAQECVPAHRLPALLPSEMSMTPGSVNSCSLCDHEIDSAERRCVRTPSGSGLFFHLDCYLAWRKECIQVFERGTRAVAGK
jgi:hypothetical protein